MLKSLSIWNFALIEYAKIDFQRGLNILTGETGAGKSILMGALGMAIGHRSNLDSLRFGSDFIRVEAVFELEKNDEKLKDFLQENNILSEDCTLIITRQISSQGRNSIQVNNCHITLAKLRQIGLYLVDIHSQHSNQLLMKEEYQLEVLDNFNKDLIAPLLKDYETSYHNWRRLVKELETYQLNTQEMAQKLDMLNWQIKEIKNAGLTCGEDAKLEEEIKLLANGEKIAKLVQDSYSVFAGCGSQQQGISSGLDKLRKNLAQLAEFNKEFATMFNIVEDAFYQLQDVEAGIRDKEYSLNYSPEKIDELQRRLNEIDKLKLKYGVTIEDILNYLAKAEHEKDLIENFDDNLEKLNKKVHEAKNVLSQKAVMLHKARVEVGKEVANGIIGQLKSLGMEAPRLHYQIELNDAYTPLGADAVNVMFSANPGEETKPLGRIASGGELSRIALALKTVMAGKDDLDLLVFDEVDTGVGGKTAIRMAEKIAMIARHRQVICITHLPQIAAMADAHYYISKYTKEGKTYTEIKLLPNSAQLKEIARMMSGTETTPIAIENAKELVDNAKKYKIGLS